MRRRVRIQDNVGWFSLGLGVSVLAGLGAYSLYRKTAGPRRVVKAITIDATPEELYDFWLVAVAEFMKGSGLQTEVVEESRSVGYIRWCATRDGNVEHHGSVHLQRATGGRGTVVRAEMVLSGIGSEVRLENALRRLKQLIETGEVVQSDASIHSGMHPAQPPVEYR